MEFITQNILWITVAVVSGSMLFVPILRGSGRFAVTPSQAVMLINRQDAIIVDVRTEAEFAAGHLPNARHISAADIEKRASELNKFKNRPIIIACQTGSRAGASVAALHKAGFEQAVHLDGGIDAWLQAGQPVSRDAS
ncbi:MAG TPA: rhodanese-like domain-containing protein [Rhodocyclaceae bacterium]|nr:rhodanese-like domain-containing protein [Rhodocyclaceae bacterium]